MSPGGKDEDRHLMNGSWVEKCNDQGRVAELVFRAGKLKRGFESSVRKLIYQHVGVIIRSFVPS
jgi:hypothetical protein